MSAPDIIVVQRGPGETRFALLAQDTVIEVAHRRDIDVHAGACVAGRVVGHAPGLAFLDIGAAQPGVLKVRAPLIEGSAVVVRVVVPPRRDKGAELKPADAVSPAPDPAAAWWARYRTTIESVVVSSAQEERRLHALIGNAPFARAANPFAEYGVDDAIDAALARDVPLPGGGRLLIDAAAAAVVIDIDAGALPPVEANAAAVPAIARALRLRNLAGHILIDVIPAQKGGARAFAADLAALLDHDPVPSQVAGVTPLGMVELTRRRDGLSLAETLSDAVANAAYKALRQAVLTAVQAHAARVAITAHPDVVAFCQTTLRAALMDAQAMGPCEIILEPKTGRAPPSLDVHAV